jgi:hypothetical protein
VGAKIGVDGTNICLASREDRVFDAFSAFDVGEGVDFVILWYSQDGSTTFSHDLDWSDFRSRIETGAIEIYQEK